MRDGKRSIARVIDNFVSGWRDGRMKIWRGVRDGVRKNGRRYSAEVGHWTVRTGRWSAAVLCAYLPLASQLPPLLPGSLLNALALLTALHVLLPSDDDRSPRGETRRPRPAHPGRAVRYAHTAGTTRTAGPARATGTTWTVAHHRRREHHASRAHRSGRSYGFRAGRCAAPRPPCPGCPALRGTTGPGQRPSGATTLVARAVPSSSRR